MALFPYTLVEPDAIGSPLIVDSPHSGRNYPSDFVYSCPLPLLRHAEDTYVDELVGGAPTIGATLLTAEFPRSMIDLNRAEDDIDPQAIAGEWETALAPDPMCLAGFGLVRRLCRSGVPLYRAPLSSGEIMRRITTYYRPYHECLHRRVVKNLQQFGLCILLDIHSMPDRVMNGLQRPDFILGDRDGTSCDPCYTRRIQKMLQDLGYRVTLNDPYKGREIVKRYGQVGQGAHALQIEINRKLYMDEATLEKTSGFEGLREDLTTFLRHVVMSLNEEAAEPLAAE